MGYDNNAMDDSFTSLHGDEVVWGSFIIIQAVSISVMSQQ